MDLLKVWLDPMVARELNAAVQWRERTPIHIRLSENGLYEDDGSNLRAKSSKPGVVQITKLVTSEAPIEAWISDSATRLKATMASSAIQKFFAESKKRVNKGILGGLIQILDFEVVATHLGPRDSQISLLIKEFKGLGSEGSSTFGELPRPIEVNQDIKELSARLKRIRAKEHAEDSTVNSQHDFDLSSDDSPMASQQALATQAQLPNPPTKRLEKEVGSPSQQDSVPISAHGARIKSSSPVEKHPNASSEMRIGISDIVGNEKATSEIQTGRSPLKYPSGATANEVRRPKNVAGLLALLPTLLPSSHLIKSITHPKLISKKIVTTEESVPEGKHRKDHEAVVEPPNPVGQSNGSSVVVEPRALVEEKESLPDAERNISPLANETYNSVGVMDSLKESAPNQSSDPALAQLSNRISEREVRVSKHQQDLLDRSDSWFPPEPGRNAPVANVPIATLQTIERVAEGLADRFSKRTQRRESLNTIQSRHSSVISESGNDSKSESDPGTSASWSLSPQNAREQLPPNSSMEIPVQLDELQEETEEEAFQLEKSVSVSSNSAASVRRNPARASKEPKLPEKVTSPLVSVSHARESRTYRCPIDGCRKTYKSYHNLKYHTEKWHPGAGSASVADTVDSESSPKATLNWFACSKCHNRFSTPGEVLQHEKNAQCSSEAHGKLAASNFADAVKAADDSSLELNSQLASPTLDDHGTSQFSHQEEANTNVASTTEEHQIPNSSGIQLSESEPLEGILPGDSKTTSTNPNNIHTNSIRSIHSNETGLSSIGRQSAAKADTESSDLEVNSQPSNSYAVHRFQHLDTDNNEYRSFPSTASQPEEPILQVRRTPYVNGYTFNAIPRPFNPHGSPSSSRSPGLAGTVFDRNTTETLREPLVINISSAEKRSTNKPAEDLSTASNGGQAGRQRTAEELDQESIAQQVQHEIDSQSQRSLNRSPFVEDNHIGIEETILPAIKNLEKTGSVAPEGIGSNSMDRNGRKIKRNSLEAQLRSPKITKRRRHSKSPESLRFRQTEQVMPDPSISGRLWRQEHFASRKDTVPLPKEEEHMHLNLKDRILSPARQPQNKASAFGQAESVGMKEDSKDLAMDLSYYSPNANLRRGSKLNREAAPVQTHKFNSVPTTVASDESFRHRQTRVEAADGEQLDVVMLDENIKDTREAREVQPGATAHIIGIEGPAQRPTIFDRFKCSYPDYSGNIEQFFNICNKIRNLVEAGREEHQSLWDDFIVRYNTEYPRYINQCVNMAEDPAPYEQFYRNEIIEARYNKLIVTRKTLSDALILKQHVLRSPTPQQPRTTTEILHVPTGLDIKERPNSSKGSFHASRPRTPVMVDLTDESEESSFVQGPKPLPRSDMKPSLPSSPWKRSEKASGISHRSNVPERAFSPSNVLISSDHLKPQLQSGRPSSLTSPIFQNPPSSSPAKITPASALSKSPLSDIFEAKSDSLVSVGPNLATLAKERVTIDRRTTTAIVESAILSESRGAAQPPAGVVDDNPGKSFASSDRRDQAKYTSILVASNGAEASRVSNGSNTGDEWRTDENSPLSFFARSYLAIEPGKGNSYANAKPASTESKHHRNMGGTGGSSTESKGLDISS
ncbi:hypothetical protein MMC07_005786 [Pseudocyphellaria aurata]|nr:hypothetical protein [Pseudocyphellaria aurata]